MTTKPLKYYEIKSLTDELILIRWLATPRRGNPVEKQFLADVQVLLDKAEKPVYFISDLRKGRIVNVETIRKLVRMLAHAKFGGSTAFSSNPITSMVVGVFTRFARHEKPEDEIWDKPEEALAYLETIKPGLTDGIDWVKVLGPGSAKV